MSSKCSFCNKILTFNEFVDFCEDLTDCPGIHYVLTKGSFGNIYLRTFSVVDDDFYNQDDFEIVTYCPKCGNKLVD